MQLLDICQLETNSIKLQSKLNNFNQQTALECLVCNKGTSCLNSPGSDSINRTDKSQHSVSATYTTIELIVALLLIGWVVCISVDYSNSNYFVSATYITVCYMFHPNKSPPPPGISSFTTPPLYLIGYHMIEPENEAVLRINYWPFWERNLSVSGGFPLKKPSNPDFFYVFFHIGQNRQLNKRSNCRWCDTQWRSSGNLWNINNAASRIKDFSTRHVVEYILSERMRTTSMDSAITKWLNHDDIL